MLNTNVFGRPFDDLTQPRIQEEATQALNIFLLAAAKLIVIKSSDVLYAEVNLIKDEAKQELTLSLIKSASSENIPVNEPVIAIADGIYPFLHDYMDCLHLAFAAFSGCDMFVTCDDEIIKKREMIESYLKNKGLNTIIKRPGELTREILGP